MASGSGGIDMLSVYNDEEEVEGRKVVVAVGLVDSVADDADGGDGDTPPNPAFETKVSALLDRHDGMDCETLRSPIAQSPTPPPLLPSQLQSSPFPAISPSPPLRHPSSSLSEPVGLQRMRMRERF
ncbi:uncharacterized protein LOC135588386 [Musa acuminata AAA Group]|uniref:uncharacterized protein LOC135588386 n=1 Tax=Musa acuminata AAA Group TaxID=214697 RepID=UPI0031CF18A1